MGKRLQQSIVHVLSLVTDVIIYIFFVNVFARWFWEHGLIDFSWLKAAING